MTSYVVVEVAGKIPEPLLKAQSTVGKFALMFFAIALFAVIFGLVLLLASLFKGKNGERVQGALFVGPAVVLLAFGLLYPAILTIVQSLRGKQGEIDSLLTEGRAAAEAHSREQRAVRLWQVAALIAILNTLLLLALLLAR